MSPDPSPLLTSTSTSGLRVEFMDFGLINTRSALQFGKIWAARSPHDVAEAMVDYGRRQFEYWTRSWKLSIVAGGKTTPDAEVVELGDSFPSSDLPVRR